MLYMDLARVYKALESTTKRLEKTEILAELFRSVEGELLPAVTILMLGRVFPTWSSEELGVGIKLLMKAISTVVGVSVEEIEDEIREQGDIGLASEKLFSRKAQTTFFSKPLTVELVYSKLRALASISGERAQSRKIDILLEILSQAKPLEAKYITRTVLEELRVGVAEGIIRDAISGAFGVDPALVERAHMLTNDLGMVALVARDEGEEGLKKLNLEPGRPVKPMLAQLADSIESAVQELGRAFCETKYDGVRVQIHRKSGEILIFTRRLENITLAVPDIVEMVEEALPDTDYIFEGEIIVKIDGRPASFQYILQRVRRKYDIDRLKVEVPLSLYVFDVLYHERPLIDEPLIKRRSILESVISEIPGKVEASHMVDVGPDNVEDAVNLFNESIREGHEGIMIKDVMAPYIPGIRGKKMLKFKAEPETLDLVVVGGTYGRGKRAHLVGSYLLAARDEDTGELMTVAHVATGLDDQTLQELSDRMEELIIERKGRKLWVKPEIVLEVAYSEIVKSPEYESGYSLRFPVVKRIRDDLSPEDVDTVSRIRSIFGESE
ncbi:ATP-dependent DNA ligase [Methanothermobacter wolfeii]|uniref:DNA ligase n=1 Tax=Methanothermobacter wolfeii TaxID=145261 RepID=A0A9E7RUY0_METWO|nr:MULTISPECIES: ATP-dependent DNA ligase [Methanothermobacter]MDI6701880.1 ATP-dependent DNA ligase [Methanothermobacter wolfeii]MDI6841325.1 ATP-dependent DNA ligase [Methanothermobacter wolfeii]NLM03352.1 ATP-dependent DNA ligase [Methanothermobacter wolfeii]QHN05718.1 ATP-dependent DNA ligase [Methanothermobacter sp. THM-1]UXH31857.1 ATP-dependent DNA ligase [Methanothermobacter wolfeii]